MSHADTHVAHGNGHVSDFKKRAALALANDRLGVIVDRGTRRQDGARRASLPELPDPMAARVMAAQIKDHTLQNLDHYLVQLTAQIERHGGRVHFARTGEQACDIIKQIARDAGVRMIIKSKSMVSEEIELNHELDAANFEVVETDLGEFILQIGDEKPSHIVVPVIHKNKQDIGKLFQEKLGIPYSDDPEVLTAAARKILREKFRVADMGITGVNFAVAETGTLVMVTNEGNGRFCASRPRVVVSLMGMEKLIPRMKDLPVFLKLLGKSATGQRITCYTSLTTGPRRAEDADGPEEFHLVILDRGRSDILASDYRSTLRCIRCGACLNACPVYRKIGGHAYDSVYPGPIGKLVTPLLNSLDEYEHLPQASSLCGACLEACPVRIDIPAMLIQMRNDLLKRGKLPISFGIGFKLWSVAMRSPMLYRIGARCARWFMRAVARDGWLKWLPGPGSQWTASRDFPALAARSFRSDWESLKREVTAGTRRER